MKTFTKTVITFILVTFCTGARLCVSPCFAQSGQTCNTAIQNYSKDSCAYQSWVISGTEYWFYFKANTPYVYISVITTKFGINAPHVHRVELYDGTCSNPILIADDELPFVDYWDELRIDLDASGLIPGNKYYIKLSRQPSGGKLCDKSTCRAMIQPAGFDICIQDVEVFIPLDFGIEPPSQSHSYVQNKGQIIDTDGNPRSDIVMVAPNSFPSVFVANTAIHYVFSKIDTSISTLDTLHRIDMTLEGANPKMRAFKTEQAQGHFNYFLPQTPTGVSSKAFSRLVWNDVYPKIDMQFYSNYNGIKFYFIVRQGGDAEDIEMKFDGASQLIVTPDSGLEIISSIGKIQFEPGHAYQINPAGNIVPMPWQAKFIKTAANKVKFDIRNYPKNMPLIIQVDRGHIISSVQGGDWSTYLGGQGTDRALDVTTDNNADLYVAGYTVSTNFPVLNNYQIGNYGNEDGFVGKFSKDAVQKWTTYYGGSNNDKINGVEFSNGFLVVTGETGSNNFPVTANAYDNTFNGVGDAFIIKFDPQDNPPLGGTPTWATFFGGCWSDRAFDVTADAFGNIYIIGNASPGACSSSKLFPLVDPGSGAYFQNIHGTDNFDDGFIAKFNISDSLVWSTYYGGNGDEYFGTAAVDPTNNGLCITGKVGYSGIKVLNPPCFAANNDSLCLCNPGGGAYFQTSNVINDAFVARFSSNGNLLWSSIFGGKSSDYGTGISVSPGGNIYLTGYTNSTDTPDVLCTVPTNGGFPLCDPYQNRMADPIFGYDIFISRFNTANQLVFSTYYGGNTEESGFSGSTKVPQITIDKYGNVFISGKTTDFSATDSFPTFFNQDLYYQKNNAHDLATGGSTDAFVLWFNNANQLRWATHYGGADLNPSTAGNDWSCGIAISNTNALYIVGSSSSNTYPLSCPVPVSGTPYCQTLIGGIPYTDAVITRFDMTAAGVGAIKENKTASSNFALYPNPNTGEFFCEPNNTSQKDITIRLYNSTGQVIYKNIFKSVIDRKIHFNIPHLSDGIYLFMFMQEEKIEYRKIYVIKGNL